MQAQGATHPWCCRRYMEEDRSHQTTLDSTPRCAAGSARAPGNRSGTPGRKTASKSKSKSTSKTPSERVRWPLRALMTLRWRRVCACCSDMLWPLEVLTQPDAVLVFPESPLCELPGPSVGLAVPSSGVRIWLSGRRWAASPSAARCR